MLHNALAIGRDKVTLIALWDGKTGDGPGGTEHMVEKARARGAKVAILDTKPLFGLSAEPGVAAPARGPGAARPAPARPWAVPRAAP